MPFNFNIEIHKNLRNIFIFVSSSFQQGSMRTWVGLLITIYGGTAATLASNLYAGHLRGAGGREFRGVVVSLYWLCVYLSDKSENLSFFITRVSEGSLEPLLLIVAVLSLRYQSELT